MKRLLTLLGYVLFAIAAVIFAILVIALVILRNVYGPPVD